jgi:PAS domain S-box-containing protein
VSGPSATSPAKFGDAARLALHHAAEAVASSGGEDIFAVLVQGACRALGVDICFIGVLDRGDPNHIHSIAVCDGGVMQPNFDYDLAGTPCQNVVGEQFRYYVQGIQERFPDPHVKAIGGVGYAAIPLFDGSGAPMGLMAAIDRKPLRDQALTESILRIFSVRAAVELERRYADEARRRSEESYRTIFEASEDALFVHDPDNGAIVDVNPKACEVYGYSREELLASDVGALSSGIPPYTVRNAARLMQQAKRGEAVRIEWHRRNKDGSLHWDEVCIKRVKIGGVDRILAVTREITDRKLREEELKKSEDRLRATVECALDCILGIDDQGRVIEFNPAAEETFGHARADVMGRSMGGLIIPKRYRRAHDDGMVRYLATGEGPYIGRRIEVTAMRADGSEFPAELAIEVAQGLDGKIFIGYLRDITERKRAEEDRLRLETQLRQAQKMEAIGQLTGGIAHDFNNILTGVMGYLVMAQERAEQLADPKLERYLERAERSGQRARELIAQMLTFSRGQRGEPRSVSLAPRLTEAVRLLQSILPSSVEIRTQVAENVPCVLLDPLHLEQVLMNLCINARDAMGGQGELTISLDTASCETCACTSCHQPVIGSFVELAVSDTGSGIEPSVLERMFEPFFSTKEVGRGSGMGLAMVHGIVHEYGGHIRVDTTPGRGTRVRIWLPAWFPPAGAGDACEDAAAVARAGERPRGLAGHVLLADDEEPVRDFMEDLLTSWGLDVTLVGNGVEACAGFAADPEAFDLVVLDQTMPRMTGLEAAEQLLKLRPGVPVVLYTGYSEHLTEARVTAAGIRALTRKPLDVPAFRAIVERLLEESQPQMNANERK